MTAPLLARVESVLNDALYGRATSTQIENVLRAVKEAQTLPTAVQAVGRIPEAAYLVGEACEELRKIIAAADVPYVDTEENWAKAKSRGYKGKKFNLGDAKRHARVADRALRKAWDLIDPTLEPFKIGAANGITKSPDAPKPGVEIFCRECGSTVQDLHLLPCPTVGR